MKILFALSQIEITGSETYALTLASALKKRGAEIILISELLRDPGGFPFYSLPLHSRNTSYFGRLQNVLNLRKILKSEQIELIHSHSRAANFVSHFARSWLKKIPMVVTVHGRWRNHFAARSLPCLGERTIAICPYLERYLIQDLGIDAKKIVMIPNGIDTEKFLPSSPANADPVILMVARFSTQKGNTIRFLIKNVFPQILELHKNYRVKIVGGKVPDADRSMLEQVNSKLGRDAIQTVETNLSTAELYPKAEVVVGSGRVALEAMACGKPVVAIGESSAPGLLRSENFEEAFDSNFGDCGVWNLFEIENSLAQDLTLILKERKLREELSEWGRKIILERFDSTKIAVRIEQFYKELMK